MQAGSPKRTKKLFVHDDWQGKNVTVIDILIKDDVTPKKCRKYDINQYKGPSVSGNDTLIHPFTIFEVGLTVGEGSHVMAINKG